MPLEQALLKFFKARQLCHELQLTEEEYCNWFYDTYLQILYRE